MSEPKPFLLQFAPEQWSPIHKLLAFVGPPFPDNSNIRIGLRDCERHLEKVKVFWRIAARLRENLALDRHELERLGATSNSNSQEFAAVCESIVSTLYSAVDGLRIHIFGVYSKIRGVQRGSNKHLFNRAERYGPGFPNEIREFFISSRNSWFPALRNFRTELIHGATGSCFLQETTNKIMYMNDGIKGEDGRAFMIEDIESWLQNAEQGVRGLVESVANFHYSKLSSVPKFQICGFYLGRWYGRIVAPGNFLDFNTGYCLSYDWFENENDCFCPLAGQCGAYKRKWPGGYRAFENNGIEEGIRLQAYYLWERRLNRGESGDALGDWLLAETGQFT